MDPSIMSMSKKHKSAQSLEATRHASAPVETATLRALAPMQGKADAYIQRHQEQAQQLHVPKGRWTPPDDEAGWLFLQRGRLLISDAADVQHPLDAGMAAARFPLPTGKGYRYRFLTSGSLIRLQPDAKKRCYEDTLIQCEEGGIEDQIYYDFYRTLQEGKCELPSMPDLAVRIGLAIDDPNTENEDIARIIQSDPALTARILSVVNSAAFGAIQQITDLNQAVARLGRQQIRSLVFSCIVKGLFRTDSKALQSRMRELWEHSCHVAAVSQALARHTPGLSPERAMLAGLVHDIGIIPILGEARNHPLLLNQLTLLDQAITNLRSEVGALALRQWQLEGDLSEIALHAEDWFRCSNALPTYVDVVQLAQLHTYIGTARMQELPRIDDIPAFHKLMVGGLTPRRSLAILDEADKEIQEVRRLLQGE